MEKKDKDLLLKDLCARLPYGVKVACNKNVYTVKGLDLIVTDEGDWEYAVTAKGIAPIEIDFIKPYLFPLSSMTEEQKKEFLSVAGYEAREEDCGRHTETYYYDMVGHEHNFYPNSDAIDWCIKNNFDYRGLIPKGLANDATGLNVY